MTGVQTCALPILTLSLSVATDSTPELIRYGLQGIRKIFRDGYEYKKAGVMLTGLVPVHQIQTDLFDAKDRARSTRLMAALDAINERWGTGAVQYASDGLDKPWKAQFQRRTPAYTTCWDDLPTVHAT